MTCAGRPGAGTGGAALEAVLGEEELGVGVGAEVMGVGEDWAGSAFDATALGAPATGADDASPPGEDESIGDAESPAGLCPLGSLPPVRGATLAHAASAHPTSPHATRDTNADDREPDRDLRRRGNEMETKVPAMKAGTLAQPDEHD